MSRGRWHRGFRDGGRKDDASRAPPLAEGFAPGGRRDGRAGAAAATELCGSFEERALAVQIEQLASIQDDWIETKRDLGPERGAVEPHRVVRSSGDGGPGTSDAMWETADADFLYRWSTKGVA